MTTDSITLYLDVQTNRELARARAEDATPTAERIRAGLGLWRDDPAFRARVDARAAVARKRRLALPLPDDRVKLRFVLGPLRQSLVDARVADSIPAAMRIRALIELWTVDPDVRRRVDGRAAELRAVPATAVAG